MIKRFILLVITVFALPLQASYVSCQLNGQLGNQLFEIATALAYAWDYGVDAVFPELHSSYLGMSTNRDRIFFRLNASTPPSPYQYQFVQQSCHSAERIPYYPNLYLKGYFQSWKYFDHHRERLLPAFSPSSNDVAYLNDKYGELIEHPKTVAIHVRMSHRWKHEENLHPFVGLDYYERAIALFDEDSLFVIFSDRISWCKRHFTSLCKNVIFIEGNDHVQDLHLMSKMKDIIVGTSSFSWWAAYLNENPHKKVVVPNQWLHENYVRCVDYLDNYYLPGWVILPVEFGQYPDDLTKQDRSESLDDN